MGGVTSCVQHNPGCSYFAVSPQYFLLIVNISSFWSRSCDCCTPGSPVLNEMELRGREERRGEGGELSDGCILFFCVGVFEVFQWDEE